MPGEIRVDVVKSNSGLGTITHNASGQVLSGITTSDKLVSNTDIELLTLPFIEMPQTIPVDYSISASKNALTAGPVTINAGIAVTIASGSNWTIV